ncbi:MAG: helix-turn-helix domain-containing protein, partial [Bacteroidota bacterium]
VRWFKARKGIPPFQYLNLLRVEKSISFLHQGLPLAETALRAGFYDQSHFHRFFLRFRGMTPGDFSRGCNIVQD